MKKSLVTLAVLLTAAALIAVFCGPAAAKVTGVCSGCHTMHNSQGGDPMATGGPLATLLTNDCVGCHSSSDSSTTYVLGTSTVPVVNFTGGAPATYLAGGNFWWVADKGGDDDAKGHNVLGISDDFLDPLPFAPGGGSCGSFNNCHKSLAEPLPEELKFMFAGNGCQGCHLNPAHHADDSATVIGAQSSSTDGYYRFLSGHGPNAYNHGVCGIEDDDWQASKGPGDHNEYLGVSASKTVPISLSSGHTVTAFCCGCHGNFHVEQQCSVITGECKWIRHPSDAVIPDTGEYADAFDAGGTGTGIYNERVPVARPSLSNVSSTVAIGTDMVMCLSCHRPHGSPNDDLLRWKYTGDGGCDAQGKSECGCFVCHTQKGTYDE